LRSGAVTPLTEFGQFGGYVQISGVAIHPSGAWAAISIWHDDGNRDLFKFDLTTHAFTRLTGDPQRDLDPAFDPSGRYLVFSSGRDGVYNLYALDLQSDTLFRVTNVLGGAFDPAVDPTGKQLAFVGYNGGGYDLYRMDFDPAQWREVQRDRPGPNAVIIGPITHDVDVRAAAIDPPTDDYCPARTAWPHYWLPDFAFGSDDFLLGAETSGGDILNYHAWNAHALWAFKREFPYLDAAYAYTRWRPIFSLHAAHIAQDHGEILESEHNGRTADYWERRVAGEAFVHYPFFLRHDAYLGYVGQWRSNLDEIPRWAESPPFTGYWSGAQAGWSYATGEALDRLMRFPAAIGGTVYTPLLGSDVTQELVGGQAGAYFPLPVHDMGFYFSALGGISFGQLLPQRTFTLGGNTQANPIVLGFNNDRFALRGYRAGVASGDAAAVGSAQYMFPIADIERGISTWPIYFRGFRGRAFGEAGFAVDKDERLRAADLYPDAGLSLYLDYVISYFVGLSFQSTVAYGFRDRDDTGGFRWQISLGDLLP
jgi:hypothetical protein